jgi:hypothetical protein
VTVNASRSTATEEEEIPRQKIKTVRKRLVTSG